VTKFIAVIATPKAAAKNELWYNKPESGPGKVNEMAKLNSTEGAGSRCITLILLL
jgi:hypothetical protein